ncbi:MAG: hypothetical protein [Bacteriophage sp.]|nr:MAG: hypothetical protein [Bacteriophage sp.]UWG73193.1 MAG: hypothetical protein [Bacteriophage sp.]
MIDIKENNKTFSELVMGLIENKYDIVFNYDVITYDDCCSRLAIDFSIGLKDIFIAVPVNYKTQVIDILVENISKRIDEQIINSYKK